MTTRTICATLIGGWLLAVSALAGQAPPDFTGIWSSDREPRAAAAPRRDDRGEFIRTAPFTPAARARVEEYRALIAPSGASPGGFCVGYGMPESILAGGGYPMEIIQRPEQITIIQEAHSEVRRIYTDGRKVDPADLIPERSGYSTGKWEGDTLVVETTSLAEAVDQYTAHGEDARVLERFHMTTDDKGVKRLKIDVTLTDPAFYTRPVTLSKTYVPSRSTRILSYDCTEPAWHEHIEKLRAEAAAGHKK